MSEVKKPHLPIGYWLKQADQTLTKAINDAQQANGLSRTDWQVLNMLFELATASQAQLIETLKPFADSDVLNATLANLGARGLLTGDTNSYQLSHQGQQIHKTALEHQKGIRQQAIQGISQADYATTVRVLGQLVQNLGSNNSDSVKRI